MKTSQWSALVLLALAMTTILVGVRLAGTSAWDLGDGALHYLQARYAPLHPHLFFDRWAKPLYVLLGSPFARIGPVGLVLFNGVIAGVTAWTIIASIDRCPTFLKWLVPIMLLGSTQYFRVAISGMTEPLFGLLSVACVCLMMKDRPGAAMAILSLTPWSRPEYVVFAPIMIGWVIAQGRWLSLSWLGLGPALYFIPGALLFQDGLWAYSKDPYQGNTDYPAGALGHFIRSAPMVLGEALLAVLIGALVLGAVQYTRDPHRRPELRTIVVLALLPVLAIWAVHSYAYWAGGHASAGLLRVLATAAPLTVLFVAHVLRSLTIDLGPRWTVVAGCAVVLGYAVWAQDDLRYKLRLPAQANVEQLLVERSATDAMAHMAPGSRVFFMHPYFALKVGLDPWAVGTTGRTWEVPQETLRPGDLVMWDPEYGPVDQRISSEELLADKRLALISLHTGGTAWGHRPYGAWLFGYTTMAPRWRTDTITDLVRRIGLEHWSTGRDQLRTQAPMRVTAKDEFPVRFPMLPACTEAHVLTRWELAVRVRSSDGPARNLFHVVLSNPDGGATDLYQETGMGPGENRIDLLLGASADHGGPNLYLWNKDRQAFVVEDLRLVRHCLLPAPLAGGGP